MKSILQEASSIERAIDKAWNEAGKPKEFTIKVLDQGERNFFGLTRRPAIVSILYKPEKSTYHPPRRRNDDRRSSGNDRSSRGRSTSNHSSRRHDSGANQSRSSRSDDTGSERAERSLRIQDMNEWRDEWRQHVNSSIRQITKLMGVKTPFQITTNDEKVLTVTFKSALLQDEEEQRMLFASLSYLSIQFLKREYKNRFAGFRIVVTGPVAAKVAEAKNEQKTEEPERNNRGNNRSSRGSGNAKRNPAKKQPNNSARLGLTDDAHLDEQLRFAKQQLEQEEELAQVFEKAVSREDREAEPKKEVVAEQQVEAPQEAPEKDLAKKQAAPNREVKPLKEGTKYQPFFVEDDTE